jgi:hypothetical protein
MIAALAATLVIAACNKPAETPAAPVVETRVIATPDVLANVPESFEEAIAALDYKTQHVIWVLPPGIHASGPFVADVEIKHDGVKRYELEIPLTADFPASGSRPEFPAGAEILRLSADATWTSRLAEVKDVVDKLKAEHGPGGGELNISSNIKTEIGAEVRKAYCEDDKMPDIGIFLEQGEPAKLYPLSIGATAPILKAAELNV